MHTPTVVDASDSPPRYRAPGAPAAVRDEIPMGRAPNGRRAAGGPGIGVRLRGRVAVTSPRAEATLVGVLVVLYHGLRRPPRWLTFPGSFNDDGVYLALGQALADGLGYRSVHLAGAPVQLKYPPGLPGLLALLWGTTGSMDAVVAIARLLNLLLVGAAAAAFWWIARRRLRLPPALAALAVVPLLLEETLQYWSLVLAEPYFVLGWAVALALALRMLDDDRESHAAAGVALGAVLAATALFRSQAAVLLPAFALVLADVRKTRRAAAAMLLTGAAPLAAWALAKAGLRRAGPVSTLPDEGSYAEWLPLGQPARWGEYLTEIAADNLGYYAQAVGRLATGSEAGWPVAALFVVAAVIGGTSRDRRRLLVALPTLAVAATVLLWPWLQARLVLPLLPAAGLLVGVACARLASRMPGGARVACGTAVAASLLAVVFAQASLREASRQVIRNRTRPKAFLAGDFLPPQSRLLALVAEWVEGNTQPGEVVLFDLPSGLFLHTGRRGAHASPAESRFTVTVHARPGRYLAERVLADGASVLVVPFERTFVEADLRVLLRDCPSAQRLVHVTPTHRYPMIYQVLRSPATDACLRAVRDGRRPAA